MSRPITYVAGGGFLPLLAESTPESERRLAARLAAVEARSLATGSQPGPEGIAAEMAEGHLQTADKPFIRWAWRASRAAVVGRGSGCRIGRLLSALDLTDLRAQPEEADELLVEVCAELGVLILMLERVWSEALVALGGSMLHVESFAVRLEPIEVRQMRDFQLVHDLAHRDARVLPGWLEYQSALILRGIELLATEGHLEERERSGISSRFARLCLETLGGIKPERTFAQSVDYPNDIGQPLAPHKEELLPMQFPILKSLAGDGVLQLTTSAGGLSLPHIQWLSNLLRFLLLKGTGWARTRDDLAFAVSLMPPTSPSPGVTRKVKLHEATLLNGVLERPGSAAVSELETILSECSDLTECGADAAAELAWALLDGADGNPNCLVSLTHDSSVLCALRRTGLPFRFIVPVVPAARLTEHNPGKPAWRLTVVDRAGATTYLLEEGFGCALAAGQDDGADQSWTTIGRDIPQGAHNEVGNKALEQLPGTGPVVVCLMGAPMERFDQSIIQRVTVGEQAVHDLFFRLRQSDVMARLLDAMLGERNVDSGGVQEEPRELLLLGIDGWSETDRHAILWLFAGWAELNAGRQSEANKPRLRVRNPKAMPSAYFAEVFGSKLETTDDLTEDVHNRARRAREAAESKGTL